MVTERFADEIVAEMENYGKWAGVNISFAPRLINMEGIGFEEGWAHFLTRYVQPLQQRTFEGYWKVYYRQFRHAKRFPSLVNLNPLTFYICNSLRKPI